MACANAQRLQFEKGGTSCAHFADMTILANEYMSATTHSIGADQMLSVAHAMMRKHHIRHLPVLTGGKLVGVLSDRDLRFVEALRDVDPNRVRIDDAMATDVYCIEPSTPLLEVATHMAELKCGSAVVMHSGKVVGIVTTTDLCRALADVLKKPVA